jgi:regulator of protease activity HflC (stomatin/prohibitin superfamily)
VSFFAILPAHERAVVSTLGRVSGVRGPGLVLIVPTLQTMKRIDIRGDVVQLRNLSVGYRVADPMLALTAVADYREAMEKLAETAFARAMSGRDSDALVFEREGIEAQVRAAMAPASDWGLAVERVAVNR